MSSVMDRLRLQNQAKTRGFSPELSNPNGNKRLRYYGLPVIDLGMGINVWAGYVTKEMATEFIENYIGTVDATLNRDVSDQHVRRIQAQIADGKFQINGDTAKFDERGHPIDAQHRFWAIISCGIPVWMILIFGVKRSAMSTVDTIRKSRSGADVMAIQGLTKYRACVAGALGWLVRYQRGTHALFRGDRFRVENSDLEAALEEHPQMVGAVEQVRKIERIANVALAGFIYYLVANHDPDLADRMVTTLEEPPPGLSFNDPFYILRNVLMALGHKRAKEPQMVIALFVKAVNAAHEGRKIDALRWRSQGATPEEFPAFWWAGYKSVVEADHQAAVRSMEADQ